jgi:hypothetical protein
MWQHVSALLTSHHQAIHEFRPYEHGVLLLVGSHKRIYRSIRTRPPQNTHTTTYYTEIYQPKPKLACNSEGTDELPEDGTQLPKHLAAAK